MRKPKSSPQPLSVMSALLAFALSALMGLGFVMVVLKTHDLFASAAFENGVPPVTALKAQIASSVRYLKSQI